MIDKLSKVDLLGDANLFGSDDSKSCSKARGRERVVVKDGKGSLVSGPPEACIVLTKMSWPMGRANETVEALMPLQLIRKGDKGSDVTIEWVDGLSLSATHA